MLDLKPLAIRTLSLLSRGAVLHRSALKAMHERRWGDAELRFEAAARRYRRDLDVEPLARLRVHQMMAQVLSGAESGRRVERCLEVERRLSQLESIESLEPPFAPVEARTMLASWLADAPGASEAQETSGNFERAAA